MIVIARNFGQLGNRLILASHLIAAAREYGVTLLNPSFAKYAQYFRSTTSDLWCRYPAESEKAAESSRGDSDRPGGPHPLTRECLYRAVYLSGRTLSHLRLTRFPCHVIRIGHEGYCDLTSDRFRRLTRSKLPILVSGWRFDSGNLITKHADAIRRHFRVVAEHEDRVEQLISGIRKTAETIVGVHIRHGDYATFRGGRYFYPVNQYVAAMRRIRRRFEDREVTFLVCSNLRLHPSDFGDLDVRLGTGHMIEDLYAFAQCDRLVGPPSTYTGWASFYGNIPLHRMMSVDEGFANIERDYPPVPDRSLVFA